MSKTTDQAFESIRIVGGLLSSKVLQDARRYQLPGQSKEDYAIEPGLTFNEEIGRYWRIAQGRWQEFQQQCERQDISSHTLAQNEWLLPLLTRVLGYDVTLSPRKQIGEREFPITHVALGGVVPLVLCGVDYDLDKGDSLFGQEGRKRSPMGLAQEYLNAETGCLWAIVSNGRYLRLLRDNPAMTRPAYIEIDFTKLFDEDNYADFATTWLFLHATRLASRNGQTELCWLEQWREKGHDEGERALDKLRYGVADALRELGTGFVAHKNNQALRDQLITGELTTDAYFQQVLRLVYRFLFLLTAEDRDVALLPKDYNGQDYSTARKLYEEGYSITKLRERARLNRHYDTHGDGWQQLLITFSGYATGQPMLAQPALGGLFAEDQCPTLEASALENRYLYRALFNLSYFEHNKTQSRINYRDMDTEEFGSVYESLLELIPQLSTEGRWRFSFMGDAEDETAASGHSRKLTGSYYTPDSLVQELIKSALEPIITDRLKSNPQQPRQAILSITVCDPACGSGHFLLAAARRLASELASIDAGTDQPTEQHYRHAIRDVVRHCIYGVDLNPMAVELCKTGLWLESIEPGKPLTFLDAHIQCGNAVIGIVDKSILDSGVPPEAYSALAGDDKEICKALKNRNTKAELHARNQDLFSEQETSKLSISLRQLELMPEENLEHVLEKEQQWKTLQISPEVAQESLRADCLTMAFLAEKNEKNAESVPLTEDFLMLQVNGSIRPSVEEFIKHYRSRYKPFHWYLRFPNIFTAGGFDLIIGNPPWKAMSPDYKEFFENYEPNIRFLTPDDQKETYERLLSIPAIFDKWQIYCRDLYASVHFIKKSGRYRMFASGNLGKGDFNIYRMFVELALTLTKPGAIVAQLVPEGLYNGANAAAIRQHLFDRFDLAFIAGFENTKGIWFPSIDSRMKFCAYLAKEGGLTKSFGAAFRINSKEKLSVLTSGKFLRMTTTVVEEFSPDAKAIMEFSSQDEVDICEQMYSLHPKFGQNIDGLPYRQYMTEVHMGNDRDLFCENPDGLPVFEGRMIDAYDYRAKGYVSGRGRAAEWEDYPFNSAKKRVKSQWFIPNKLLPEKTMDRVKEYRIGFCDVASPTNSRSLVAAVLPANSISGHKVPTITFHNGNIKHLLFWLGIANSFVMDFLVRMKVALTMSYTIMDSLPFPRDIKIISVTDQIINRVFQLVSSGDEMEQLRRYVFDQGIINESFDAIDDPIDRHRIASEIDALVARDVYKLTRRQMLYILDPKNVEGMDCEFETFKALRNHEMRKFGEYRTQRLILEAWDKLDCGELS